MLRRVVQALFCKQISFCSWRVLLDAITASLNDDEKKLPRSSGVLTSNVLWEVTCTYHFSNIVNNLKTRPKFKHAMIMTSPSAAPAFALFTLMVPTPPRIFNTFWLHFYVLAGRKTQLRII